MAGEANDAAVIAASLTDPEAFAAIFDRHYDAVFRFAERRVGWEAARELASEVFETAFRLRAQFAAESARPWLYGIASRRVLHEHRRFARYTAATRRLAYRSDRPEPQPVADLADARADAAAIRHALDQLDAESRELLLLVAWDGLTYAEVAEALTLPIGTVRSKLHRARRALASLAGLHDEESEVLR